MPVWKLTPTDLTPWHSPALVKAERIDNPRYEAEGPTEILDPTF